MERLRLDFFAGNQVKNHKISALNNRIEMTQAKIRRLDDKIEAKRNKRLEAARRLAELFRQLRVELVKEDADKP